MKQAIFAVVFSALCVAPAFAQQPAASDIATVAESMKTSGQLVTTASGARLGRVLRVEEDGSLSVVGETGVLRLPADSLSVEDGRIVTSLTRAQISRLNR